MIKKLSLFFLLLFFCFNCFSQLTFKHLSVIDGLSQSTVLSIYKDSRGFMWFGTRDCLNRYDGRNIKTYKNEVNQPNSIISDDYIYSIAEDSDNQLWIGTQKGLSYYSPEKDNFEQITYHEAKRTDANSFAVLSILVAKNGKIWFGTNDGLSILENNKSRNFKTITTKEGLLSNEVYCVFEDSKANIWLGTVAGVSKLALNPKTKKYQITNFKNKPNGLKGNFIATIAEDKQGNIWMGSDKEGISIYHPQTKTFSYLNTKNSDLSNDIIRRIVMSEDNKVWIGTMNGLNVYSIKNQTVEVYKNDSDNTKSINNNSIKSIFIDEKGSVWIGTNFGGVNIAHPNTIVFSTIRNNKYKNSISGDLISVIGADKTGNLLIGTEGNGLNYYNKSTKMFTNYINNAKNDHSISSNTVKSIYKDKSENIWLGLYEGGLEKFDVENNRFIHYKPNENIEGNLNFGYVSSISEDLEGNLWIGTSRKGLNILNKKTNSFTYINDKTSGKRISSNYIRNILTDSKGNMWVGTVAGLNVLKRNTLDFETFLKGDSGLVSHYINCIQEDKYGNIWVGAHKGGLSKYQPKTNNFKNYSKDDGLISNNVVAINFDNDGNLWVSTDNGLSKFDVKNHVFKNFDVSDGLPSNEFSINSTYKDTSGILYFGTYNGLVSFQPHDFLYNKTEPKVIFTNLKLFNKTVNVNGEDGILNKDISVNNKIIFKASQNVFTIDFVAFNYINPERNSYAYKLEGFEKDWNYVDNPSATYTNLPAGTYSLLVKGSNNDGVWNETPTKLEIKVLPPLWKTWWAYLIYTVLFWILLVRINAFLRKQQQLKTELYYEHLNNERQEELYQSKLDFFTKISHEIRTPLTLIFAPLEKLIGATKSDSLLNGQLQNIKSNTDRLLRLINELLDFRKIETGNLKLKVSKVNLKQYCLTIFNAFKTHAKEKEIRYSFNDLSDEIDVYIDKHQMEKVLFNLLSNAFKFTPKNGTISLNVFVENEFVKIEVEDNGQGISVDDQSKIFNNFYQSKKQQSIGWGIGLALTKNIVEVHKGEIFLTSQLAKGNTFGKTVFTVLLKTGKAHFSKDELLENTFSELEELQSEAFLPKAVLEAQVEEHLETTNNKKYTIQIVEDNIELREFLVQSLQHNYNIIASVNGKDGLDTALEQVPDLIISDVTMPEMDGVEMCKVLKQNIVTSHIPVIMLTAMASHLQQVDGLEAGANIYLTKPFSVQILELNIKNLLLSIEQLKQKYTKQVMLMPKHVEIESPEEIFLDKLVTLIENNIENSDFNVGSLVEEIGMSQTVLYKKIKALTGMTITDFLKSIRLKRAAQLLKQNKINISEVAYSVGFNDRKYFSKEFKKLFGKSPTEYIETE